MVQLLDMSKARVLRVRALPTINARTTSTAAVAPDATTRAKEGRVRFLVLQVHMRP